MEQKLICEVCNKNEALGVACVPGVPMSAAYCKECLTANAHPLPILIANTVCCGGLEHTADWWKEMVNSSLKHLGKTIEWFNSKVEIGIKEEKEFLKNLEEKENGTKNN